VNGRSRDAPTAVRRSTGTFTGTGTVTGTARKHEGPATGGGPFTSPDRGVGYWPGAPLGGAAPASCSIFSEMMPMRSTPAPRAASMASTILA